MAITIRDVKLEEERKLANKEPRKEIILGRLVSVSGTVKVPGRPNYAYFLDWNQPESGPPATVFNDTVPFLDNLPVITALSPTPPYERRVIGLYHQGVIQNNPKNAGAGSVGNHGKTHEYLTEENYGHDRVRVFQPALQMFKVTGNANLTVTIQPGVYHRNGLLGTYGGGVYDLTSYLPTAGNKLRLFIYLNTTSNTVEFTPSTEISSGSAVEPAYVPFPNNAIPLAYVILEDTTTSILNTDITDARSFMSSQQETLTPRRAGDILISLDGVSYAAGEPVTNRFGQIITDSNGHIVVI